MTPEVPMLGWSVQWRSGPNNVDKKVNRHLIWPHGADRKVSWTAPHPVWFKTRREAKAWRDEHYGYIARRADLREYPHDWKPPVVVRATLEIKEIERDYHPQRSGRSSDGAKGRSGKRRPRKQ